MSRRRDAHHAHAAAVSALGKTLTRRAASTCELCKKTEDLRPIEVPPTLETPDTSRALLGCTSCRELLASDRMPRDPQNLRFLEDAVWSDVMPVKLAAIRLLQRIAPEVAWARDVADTLWIEEEIEALL